MNEPREGKLFIDGKWRIASDGGTFEVINPAAERDRDSGPAPTLMRR
jgi:acyl-CoA reductase-like NAD-dependent aldehyde dehydrogenase